MEESNTASTYFGVSLPDPTYLITHSLCEYSEFIPDILTDDYWTVVTL